MIINKIPDMIIKSPLQPLTLSKVNAIALHHMAHPTWDVKQVESYHVNVNGWRAIGYNFWVAFDGTVYEGRGFNVGAGVENQNGTVISVGFQGDYEKVNKVMPDSQFNAGVDIINYIIEKIPSVKTIGGHEDFMSTSCPGQYFPLAEMVKRNRRGTENMFTDVSVKDWAYQHIKKLKDFGIVNGDGDGNFRPDDMITRREAAVMISNAITYMGK